MEDNYIESMQEIYEKYKRDNETLHIECDYILVQFLNELGYTKITELYDEIGEDFWYA